MANARDYEDILSLSQRLLKAAREAEIRAAREAGRLEQERESARQRFGTDSTETLRSILQAKEKNLARMEADLRDAVDSFQRDYGESL